MPVLYRAVRAAALDPTLDPERPDRLGVADPVLKWLERMLENEGYVFGDIEEGSYVRRGQTLRQMQVRVGQKTYVQDRNQHRYSPRKGDRVLYRAASGRQLTPNVTSVLFIPINGQEY